MRMLVVLALFAVSGCRPRAPEEARSLPAVSLPAELDRVLRDYESAYAQRDSSALAVLFADDGILLPLGRHAVRGAGEVAAELSREGGSLALVPVAYGISDSVGYIVGTFGAEQAADKGGKFVLALRRRAPGPWRIAADIANPNRR
jgi:ketosteroid isomerase-like protein